MQYKYNSASLALKFTVCTIRILGVLSVGFFLRFNKSCSVNNTCHYSAVSGLITVEMLYQ